MMDRGGCSFVTKVRNAQYVGAVAAVIADNKCLCDRKDTCTPLPDDECELREPLMADDGSTEDITIPSVLLFKEDADVIKDTLLKNKVVRMEMSWPVPEPNNTVHYELWFTPTDPITDFLNNFDVAAAALGKRASFTPHMYIYDGYEADCVVNSTADESPCGSLCTNAGRYCAPDPDDNLEYGASGADVVKESLRRECIWNIYGREGGHEAPDAHDNHGANRDKHGKEPHRFRGQEWWDYIQYFMANCDTTILFISESCISQAYVVAGIDPIQVKKCMNDSGGIVNATVNTILDDQLTAKKNRNVVVLPVVYVNDEPIRGYLDFSVIFKAVCAGFRDTPEICSHCSNCADEYGCVVAGGHCPGTSSANGVSSHTFVASLFGVMAFVSLAAYLLHRRSQSHMREQVKVIMAEYMPIQKGRKQPSTKLVDDDDYELAFQVS
jgi:hypothetical protein